MIKGKFDFKELEKYQKKLEKMAKKEKEFQEFCGMCAKEITALLLSLVISGTTVGNNTTYLDSEGRERVMKNGGTLRRGWVARTEKEAESGANTNIDANEIQKYINSLAITQNRKYLYY